MATTVMHSSGPNFTTVPMSASEEPPRLLGHRRQDAIGGGLGRDERGDTPQGSLLAG